MNKLKILPIAIFAAILLTGCTSQTSTPSTSDTKTITISEVAQHASRSDCWMAISGKVYNVTNYISQHPGGNDIVEGCGKDATQLFATKGGEGQDHTRSAKSLMDTYFIGNLVN